jgi:hypothetical protein
MNHMPDGNSAALRAHESAEARAEERWEAYGERAIQSVVDDVLGGQILRNVNPSPPKDQAPLDFIEDVADWVSADELAMLITGNTDTTDVLRQRLSKRLTEAVRTWCEETEAGRSLVNQIINDMDDDARERAKGDI